MSWTGLRITPAADRDGVIAALFAAGSQGVQEDGDAVVTHFPPGADLVAVRRAVATSDPGAEISTFETCEVRSDEWRASVGAHELGAITVMPPWLADGRDPSRTVVIEPAMAFGTGEHATTRGVIRLMQRVIRTGDTIADLGAGSAVLSIAAAKLGATRVAAIELDADAIANAEANVTRNGVAGFVHLIEGDAAVLLPLVAPVSLVIANIISSVLLQLLPLIANAVAAGDHAILSGILVEERELMLAAVAPEWRIVAEDTEDGWWTVLLARR